jgi:large subunit ribosomal protein L31
MKKNIHPQWYPEAKVTCACGNIFTVGSTKPEIYVEVCSACHPFFTGEMKFVDTAGNVEKFKQRQQRAVPNLVKKSQKRLLRKMEEERKEKERPKNLHEMFRKAQ